MLRPINHYLLYLKGRSKEGGKELRKEKTRSGPKRPAAEIQGGGFFWIHGFIGPIWFIVRRLKNSSLLALLTSLNSLTEDEEED